MVCLSLALLKVALDVFQCKISFPLNHVFVPQVPLLCISLDDCSRYFMSFSFSKAFFLLDIVPNCSKRFDLMSDEHAATHVFPYQEQTIS